jgi:dihydrofolate reductase
MKTIAIVAHDPDRLIGADGDLPWHLPNDLKHFKNTTSGHPIVMGRKTYEAIGRPLPKRQNIVITRDENWSAPGTDVIHEPSDLNSLELTHEEPIYIIGGAEIYKLFLPIVDELLVTHVKKRYEGDVWFPAYEHLFDEPELLEETDEYCIKRYRRTRGLDS